VDADLAVVLGGLLRCPRGDKRVFSRPRSAARPTVAGTLAAVFAPLAVLLYERK
jgi:hypothetical protein